MNRGSKKQWLGLGLSCAMLLCACGQKNAESDAGNTPVPEVSIEPTKVVELTKIPEPTKAPEATEVPKPTEALEPTKVPELTEAPEATKVPEVLLTSSPTPELTEAPEPTKAPEPSLEPSPTMAAGIALDEAHFPDEAFRAYLAVYVDLDGNGVLSQEERDAVTWIGNAKDMGGKDSSTYKKAEHQQLLAAGAIRSFEGIEYFENLREIQLYIWSQAEKLHLDNPKLEVVAVTVPTLKEFSLSNAAKVKRFWYAACGTEEIEWESMQNLEYLRVEGMDVNLSMLTQYEKLTDISIKDGGIKAEQAKVDFSPLQQLQEVNLFLSEKAEQSDSVVLEELDFAGNSRLEYVGLSRKLTEKLVLPDFETYYWFKGKGEDCQVSFYAEVVAECPENLEEGAVPLNAEHFPDVAFRQYLYLYVDKDRDRILSTKECEAVTRIRNAHWDHDKDEIWNEGNWDTIYDGEEEEFDYASRITDLRGIEYFTNLYEIQLGGIKLSEELNELVLSNPKLEIIDLSFAGAIDQLDLGGCTSLRYCKIWANKNENEGKSISLDLEGLERIVELYLSDNIKTTTEVVLAEPTPLPTPELPYADHAMDWKDEKLEEAMRKVTEIYDREIMLSDVYDITSLYLWGKEIEDISALAELKSLEELKIGNNKITDISVLAELPNLRKLEMQENEIVDISALKMATNLERINANDNQIEDISALAELSSLCWIELGNNCIRDISCLKGLEALECLRLNNNQITDIGVLSGLLKLKDVWLANNQITSVTDLTDLPELSLLHLNHNQITTVHLSGLPKLWALDLQDNQISDISLSDLPELGMLELDNNCIRDVSGLTSLKDLGALGLTGNPVENIELLDFVRELDY